MRYIDRHIGKFFFMNLKDAELGGGQAHQRVRQGHVDTQTSCSPRTDTGFQKDKLSENRLKRRRTKRLTVAGAGDQVRE